MQQTAGTVAVVVQPRPEIGIGCSRGQRRAAQSRLRHYRHQRIEDPMRTGDRARAPSPPAANRHENR